MDSGAEVPAGSATRPGSCIVPGRQIARALERALASAMAAGRRRCAFAEAPRFLSVGRSGSVSDECTRAGYIQQVRGPAGSHHNFEFRVFAANLAGSSRQLAPRDLSTVLALSSRLNGPTFSHAHAVFHVEPHNPRAIVKLREDSGRALRATCPSTADLSCSEVDAAPTRRLTT